MFKNYLTVAVRNLLRHKGYSTINILGLAIGMASCILIMLYIQHELSYDRHHEKADQIYRVIRKNHMEGKSPEFSTGTLGPLGPALRSDFPEIQNVVRMYGRPSRISYGDRGFFQYVIVADASILDVFNLPLAKGDRKTALKDPYSILMTERMARKYFGEGDPIGKVLTLEDKVYIGGEYTVTGILKDIPQSSHFGFDFLSSTITPFQEMQSAWNEWRLNPSSYRPVRTYLLLPEKYDHTELERKLPDFVSSVMGPEVREYTTYDLQPLTRIYLYSKVDYGMRWGGDIASIYIFSGIAFFILLIACINFMNLATARSINRAREVGMRKVVGAHRFQLIRQFLGESIFLSLLALLLALLLIELALPEFNAFTRKELSLNPESNVFILIGLLSVVLFVGVLAGSYPAFFLSAFRPIDTLKGTLKAGSQSAWFRKGLVVFQFFISIALIIGTIIVFNQLQYIQNKNLGFDKEQIVVMKIFWYDRSLIDRYETVKEAFLQHPNVLKVAASLQRIGTGRAPRKVLRLRGTGGETRQMNMLSVDEDFLDVFNLKLVKGRTLSQNAARGTALEFILNETAVKQLGWSDPLGKELEWLHQETPDPVIGTVVGVVEDFHIGSLHEGIGPVFICKWQPWFRVISLKIHPENIPETMGFIEDTWKKFLPKAEFEFAFLDEWIGWMYRTEMRLGKIFNICSLLSIFVACLGLFGLVSFTAEQRTKEIGIRKVLGASVSNIVMLLSKDFLKPVVIGNLIALPIAYYATSKWLQNFVYRIDLGAEPFVLGGTVALLIALLTIGRQAFKAATVNPTDALRHE